jgi:hypothetical protein
MGSRRRQRPGVGSVGGALALAGVVAGTTANAQPRGWTLDRLELAPAGDRFLLAEHARFGAPGAPTFHGGLVLSEAWRPLVVPGPSERPSAVEHAASARLRASVAVAGRLSLGLELPFVAMVAGPAAARVTDAPLSLVAIGDPRVGLRARIAGDPERDPVSVTAGAQLIAGFVNPAGRRSFVTDEAPRGRLTLALAGRHRALRWAMTHAYDGRPRVFWPSGAGDSLVASAWTVGVGVSWALPVLRAQLGLEGAAQSPIERLGSLRDASVELLGSLRIQPAPWIDLAFALGPGLSPAAGTPALRALAAITVGSFEESPRGDLNHGAMIHHGPARAPAPARVPPVSPSRPRTAPPRPSRPALPTEPPATPRDPGRIELAALTDARITMSPRLRNGLGLSVELRGRLFEGAGLLVGARARYLRYGCAAPSPAEPGGFCAPVPGADASAPRTVVGIDALELAPAVGGYVLRHDGPFSVYVLLSPQWVILRAAIDRPDGASSSEQVGTFSALVLSGLQLRAGPGEVLMELGYALTLAQTRLLGAIPVGGVHFGLGIRLR